MSRAPTRVIVRPRRYGFDPESDDNIEGDDTDTEGEDNPDSDASSGDSFADDDDNPDSDASSGDSLADDDDNSGVDHPPVNMTFVEPGSEENRVVEIDFSGQTGWNNNIDTTSFEEEDYISLLLPEQLFDSLSKWTNSRATIFRAAIFIEREEEFVWKDTNSEEMKKFIGLTLQMGIIRKPDIRSYWRTDDLMITPFFLKKESMSRDRYLNILKFIRFSDPYLVDTTSPNSRIDMFLILVNDICKQYTPSKNLSIDESLLLHKGRLKFKMFIRTKRARFGMKLFVLADSFGYVSHITVYYGKDTPNPVIVGVPDELTKSELIVVHLLDQAGFLDKGYIVHIDNWYCSSRLAEYLHRRKTGVRGTIRAKRGVPEILQEQALASNSMRFFRKDERLFVKFMDKKVVYFVTTTDTANFVEKERTTRGGGKTKIKKPSCIEKYNKLMGGVDVQDQLMEYYNPVRKSHAWFKKLGFNIIQRLIINAFLRYRAEKNAKARFFDFIKKAVLLLTQIPCEGIQKSRNTYGNRPPAVPAQLHYCVPIPSTPGKARPTKRCRICYRNGLRKDSRYHCSTCTDQPGLCKGCFDLYHRG